jgi:hypothetical protein
MAKKMSTKRTGKSTIAVLSKTVKMVKKAASLEEQNAGVFADKHLVMASNRTFRKHGLAVEESL